MTSVIMIAPLNAANFESGNASDGQVLTADGAGGSAWEDAAGGGGYITPPYLGALGGDVLPVSSGELVTAWTAVVGRLPVSGDMASFVDYNGAYGGALLAIRVGEIGQLVPGWLLIGDGSPMSQTIFD